LSYKTLNIRILQTKLQIIHDKTALQSNFATIPMRLAKLLHSMGRRGFFQSTPTRIRTILCWSKNVALLYYIVYKECSFATSSKMLLHEEFSFATSSTLLYYDNAIK